MKNDFGKFVANANYNSHFYFDTFHNMKMIWKSIYDGPQKFQLINFLTYSKVYSSKIVNTIAKDRNFDLIFLLS